MPDYRFDGIEKDPDEGYKVELDFYPLAVLAREPNKLYAAADIRRPRVPNGFAYQTSSGGLSGSREPRWSTTLGGSTPDGAVTWTTIAATAANGMNAVSSPTAVSDPSGITVSNVSVVDSREVFATYTGGTLGQGYDVVITVTIDGVPRVARQRVEVVKR